MKKPSMLSGIVAAIVITLASIPVTIVLQTAMDSDDAFKLTVLAVSVCYLIYLVNNRRRRVGSFTLLSLSLIVLGFASLANANLASMILLGTGLIWMLRSWLFYRSLISVAADFVLCLTSLGGALLAFHYSGGYIGALWCFFLIQALFVLIPGEDGLTRAGGAAALGGSRFEQARNTAEAALDRIARASANHTKQFDTGEN